MIALRLPFFYSASLRCLFLAFSLVLAQGCARGKVSLPKPDAPLKDRQAAFDRYAMPPNMSLDELKAWSTYPGAPISQQSVLPDFATKVDPRIYLALGVGLAGLSTVFMPGLPLPLHWAGLSAYQLSAASPWVLENHELNRGGYNRLLSSRLGLDARAPEDFDKRYDNARELGRASYFVASIHFHNSERLEWGRYYGIQYGTHHVNNIELGWGFGFESGFYLEPIFGFFMPSGSVNWNDSAGNRIVSQDWTQYFVLPGVNVGKSWPLRIGAWNPARVWGLGLGVGPAWVGVTLRDFDGSDTMTGARSIAAQGFWIRPYVRLMNILPRGRLQIETDLGWRWTQAGEYALASGGDGFVAHPKAALDDLGRPTAPELYGLELAIRIRYGKQPFVRHEKVLLPPLPAASPSSTIGPPPPLTP